ncbi:GntR family transcriptional regulator [Amycolatopsis sp. NBRC 101858]|uniref:FadR/GntR family transcriptional regulator n=1 Tax=Amycolatopsis sp. NBRC 101858 TaxID=3032200 RepID=UPI0024A47A89|nr:FCD domain-containing protein [Amycolatopsis sp. NBRC 101858]GLY38955.1 GntR family transcriptional regulator [Amycolatopsis sp. NBRC 101858]
MTAGPVAAAKADSPEEKRAARIARSLEDEIIDRGWPVGEVLGSETELRERFGVSRAVLREAVRLVEHHQVGRMRRGPNGGLVVVAPDAGPATRALVIYLEYLGTSVEDLLAARLLLEPLAARLAAEAVTEEGIDALRAGLTDEEAGLGAGPVRDDALHTLLGKLSGNPVLGLFTDVLIRLTYRYARTSRRTSPDSVLAATTDAHSWHRGIIEAVIAGDASAAETRLIEHLGSVEEWLLTHRVRTPPGRRSGRPPAPAEAHGQKLAEVIAERIQLDIADDGWKVGSVFGSETDLVERYGVSRAALREAVRLLEHHSVARMRRGPGGGLLVEAPDPTASIRTMALYLDHQSLTGQDLRLVREAIELGCLGNLAKAPDLVPAAAGLLGAAIDRAADGGESGDVFHAKLAELAGNPVLALFLQIITELWTRHSRAERPADAATGDEVRRVHQAILDAVLAGDAALAQHRMRRHLQALTAWWQ